MAVAADVAALPADDEEHEIAVAGVPETARRRGLDMAETARLELEPLAFDLEDRAAPVHEVQLVLVVVVVLEPAGARREHHRVRAEGVHPQRPPNLAEDARAQLVDGAVGEAHGRIVVECPSGPVVLCRREEYSRGSS